MLKQMIPKDRILRRALCGFIFFVVLSVIAGALAERGRYGYRERGQKELAQIAWQYGLRSPQVDSALQRVGGGLHRSELVALLDPATGKAAAAFPAEAVGKSPEEMTSPSGVKLPSLQALLRHGHLYLRRPDPKQSSGLSREHRDRVMVSIAPLSPWEEHPDNERHPSASAPVPATAPETEQRTPPTAGEEHGRWRHHRFDQIEPPVAYLLVVSSPAALSASVIAARTIAVLGALSLLVYWLSIAWWTFMDARGGGYRAFAWGLLVLCTNLAGAAVYLIARKDWRECPHCGQGIDKRFRYCPSCAQVLKAACTKCGQALQQNWVYCADCGTSRESADKTE
jgi:hypothetical protein